MFLCVFSSVCQLVCALMGVKNLPGKNTDKEGMMRESVSMLRHFLYRGQTQLKKIGKLCYKIIIVII